MTWIEYYRTFRCEFYKDKRLQAWVGALKIRNLTAALVQSSQSFLPFHARVTMCEIIKVGGNNESKRESKYES